MLPDFSSFPPDTVLPLALIMFAAGIVKGAIGFGFPLVAISLLTLFYSVENSLAIISIPLIATNLKLALANQHIVQTLAIFKALALSVVVGTVAGVAILSYVNTDFVLILLGILVIFFTLAGSVKLPVQFAPLGSRSELLVGTITGTFGGLTSSYGLLLAAYLKSRNLEKSEFVSTLCLMILVGAFTLTASIGAFGFYSFEQFAISLLACIPTFIGLFCGEVVRGRINTELFYKVVMGVILLMSINLICKGLQISPLAPS